jgi:hypothetical protein
MSCTEKKIIKSKDDKPKKVIKTKIGLSFLYFLMLTTLYYLLTLRVFFTLLLIATTLSISLIHKTKVFNIDILKKYDSHPTVKKMWYYYSFVMGIVFRIMQPFHGFLENKIINIKDLLWSNFYDGLLNSSTTQNNLIFGTCNFQTQNQHSKTISEPNTHLNAMEEFLKINDFFEKELGEKLISHKASTNTSNTINSNETEKIKEICETNDTNDINNTNNTK